jgi:hypothetical protein
LKKKFGDRIGDGSFENAKNESEPMGFSSLRAVKMKRRGDTDFRLTVLYNIALLRNPEFDPLGNVLNSQF